MAHEVLWHTTAGTLRGLYHGGVESYLGIPYGASTAGEGRFAAPRPVESWTGVRDALAFGPSAPQVDTRLLARHRTAEVLGLLYPRTGSPIEGGPMSEDCLRLNVWTPSSEPGARLPVLVWLHGGGHVHGSGNEMVFNGDRLARDQQVVVVTVTHRLGVLGYLDLRELDVPASANAGLLDILQALNWVRDHIASVGGDPENMTLAGQSGGSQKSAAVASMPAARGLVRRCALMSFPAVRVLEREESALTRRRVLTLLGTSTVKELRELSVGRLLDVQRFMLDLPEGDADERTSGMMSFGPSLDQALPFHPFTPTPSPGLSGIELLVGYTTHEMAFMLADSEEFGPSMTDRDAARLVGPTRFEQLRAAHPTEPAHLVYARSMSDDVFKSPIRQLAETASTMSTTYAYEFAEQTYVLGGLLGASHSLDLAYFFGTTSRIPLTGDAGPRRSRAQALAMEALGSFVSSGRPTSDGTPWQPWTTNERPIYELSGAGVTLRPSADPNSTPMRATTVAASSGR